MLKAKLESSGATNPTVSRISVEVETKEKITINSQ